MSPLHVILAAGGTGGHIEPALNVGDALRSMDPQVNVVVVGSERGLEGELVPARGYRLRTVPAVPLPRRPGADLVRLAPRLSRSVRAATQILRDEQADVVVGFGGYAAVPAYLAARRAHTPIVIHEANARPGIANRLGARFTSHVYAVPAAHMRGAHDLGIPLRAALTRVDRAAMRAQARAELGIHGDGPVLLVFGGSQGAAHLNAVVAQALPTLLAAGVTVLHAYGSRNEAPTAQSGYLPVAYLDRMDLAYAAADLALTRAGAMTCAELAAVGLPALYVPLPIGNGEQRLNAAPVVEAGGGIMVADADLTAEWLTETAIPLLHDGPRLQQMAAAAHRLGVRDASDQLARIILQVGGAA